MGSVTGRAAHICVPHTCVCEQGGIDVFVSELEETMLFAKTRRLLFAPFVSQQFCCAAFRTLCWGDLFTQD